MKEDGEKTADSLEASKGAGITFLATLSGKFMIFSYTIFLARIVEHSTLGIYFLGLVIIQGVTLFSCFGLNFGAIRYLAISHSRNDIHSIKGIVVSALQIGLVISIAASFLFYCIADVIAVHIFSKPLLGEALILFAIGIPFEVLLKIFLATLKGIRNIRDSVLIEHTLWLGLRLTFGMIFVIIFDDNLTALVLAYCMSSFISAIIAGGCVSRKIPLFDRSIKSEYHRSELLHFSLPMVFSSLVYNLMGNIDIFMLGIFVGSAEVGVYSVVARIVAFVGIFYASFLPIFQPLAAKLQDSKEIQRLASLLKSCTKWSISISFPFLISLLVAPEFILSFFGQTFLQGTQCLQILTIALALNYSTMLTASVIVMSGKSKISLYNNVFAIIVNVILNLYLIRQFGIVGAAMSTGATFTLLAAIRIIQVHRFFNIHAFQKEYWKPIASSVLSIVSVFAFNLFCASDSFFSLSTKVFLIFIVYSGCMILFGLNEQDRYLLDKFSAKLRKAQLQS